MNQEKPLPESSSAELGPAVPFETSGIGSVSVLLVALMGSVLLWLSFAPVSVWPLAWIAITPWCWLVETKHLRGRRVTLSIWLAGFIYWLATLYFVPIPHPALWAGWFVFSLYLSIFLPLFVGLSRVLTHRFGVPSMISVPVIWTGLEFLRSNYIVAFGTILLGHTQYRFPLMIQTADLFGMYTVSFLMALFSIAVTKIWMSRDSWTEVVLPGVVAILVVSGMFGYGFWKLGQDRVDPESPLVRAALIQGSIDTKFIDDPDEALKHFQHRVHQYRDLTWQARAQANELDLIIWPETIFAEAFIVPNPEEASLPHETRSLLHDARNAMRYFWGGATGQYPFEGAAPPGDWEPIALMTGIPGYDPVREVGFNSAVLIDEKGQVPQFYSKRHRVIFGEYVPFADWFPILKKMTPIQDGIAAGDQAKCFSFGGLNFVPGICFESTVPHLVRQDVVDLAAAGQEPDILVNLTNDGWFYGTSCLDHHLACNVFRAVEMRKPVLVCANTGFSAVIDSAGQQKNLGPRRDTGVLYVNAEREKMQFSLYREYGDIVPWLMGMTCIATWLISLVWRPAKPDEQPTTGNG